MLPIAPYVRVIADEDGGVLLDIRRNANFGLNRTTHYIWQCIEKQIPVEEIVAALCTKTGESSEVITGDVLAFIQELRKNKILLDRYPAFHRRRSILQALLLFLFYDLCVPPVSAFRRRSFWLILRAISGWRTAVKAVPPERVAEVTEAVEAACSWYPKQVKCLQRSVATTYLLRRQGIAAAFVYGGTKLPFEEHAWIEVNGQVTNDKPEYVSRFIVFERC